MASRLPPGIGEDLNSPILYNPYQAGALDAQRKRFCLICRTVGQTDNRGKFKCAKCGTEHKNNLTAPRIFNRFGLFAGRRGGKTKVGAMMARSESLVDGSLGWVMGPTYPILRDSTMPTFIKMIPPSWVKNWSQDALELTLVNGAQIMFRSVDDPERARGQGPDWGWLDEAAQGSERAWDVFRPSLSEKAGIMIFSTTVLGYDWTYERVEKQGLIYHTPGWWVAKWKTIENPIFQNSEVLIREIEEARATMSPDFFAQEYLGERRNFTGAIYGNLVDQQTLHDDNAVKQLIPEWPNIDPSRPTVIGLDSGADHPFGAVLIVVTPRGLVVVDDYLKRQQAYIQHMMAIRHDFGRADNTQSTWASNKNEAQLRLEFGLQGIGVTPVENKHEIGIQRVQSWLYARQLWFAYTAPRTIEQMRMYRYAENVKTDGTKKAKEEVYKKDDELPDAVRYAVMAWPELPKIVNDLSASDALRLASFTEKTRQELADMREIRESRDKADLQPGEAGYPQGEFFGHDGGGDGPVSDWNDMFQI